MKHSLFMAHPWHGISPELNKEGSVISFIEILPQDQIKYEIDKVSGFLKVDRPQKFSNVVPYPYGFIPQTYSGRRVAELSEKRGLQVNKGDGDPIDVLVISDRPILRSALIIRIQLIGGLAISDNHEADDKLIGIVSQDANYFGWKDITDLPESITKRLEHYFSTYKYWDDLNKSKLITSRWYSKGEAIDVVEKGMEDYREKFCNDL